MDREKWLCSYRAELIAKSLPAKYIAELCSEVFDHWDDVDREDVAGNSALARIGCPKGAAEVASREFRYPTWIGRHPLLAMVIGPCPLLLGCWYAYAVLVIWIVTSDVYEVSFGSAKFAWLFTGWIPSVLVALVAFVWWSSQRRVIWLVPIAGFAITFTYWFSPYAYASDSGREIGYGCCTSMAVPALWMPFLIVTIAAAARFQVDRRYILAT